MLSTAELERMLVEDRQQRAKSDHLRLYERGLVARADEDDLDDAGPLDDDCIALLLAIAELLDDWLERAWDPGKHPRGPGGRFRSIVDRLKDAISTHLDNDNDGHPFDGFDREQLRKVAKARGITLKRGEDKDSIAEKLLAHLREGKSNGPAKPVKPKPTAKKATPRQPKKIAAAAAKEHSDFSGYEGPLRRSPDDDFSNELRDLYLKDSLGKLDYAGWERLDAMMREDGEYDRSDQGTFSRVRQEAQNEASLLWWRDTFAPHLSDEEIKAEMARRSREAWTGKKIGVRVTTGTLAHILDDGRIKTQFETNSSNGLVDLGRRESAEDNWFGLDIYTNPRLRPVYGFVAVEGVRPTRADDALTQYGPVQVILKDSVRRRTTAVWGDSLNHSEFGMPEPVNDPGWRSYTLTPRAIGNGQLRLLDRDVTGDEWRTKNYVEAQIHSGVTLDDIEEIVLASPPPRELRAKLDASGLKWRVLQ